MSFDRARVRLVAAFTLLSIPAHAVPPSSSAPKTDNPSADSTPPAGPSPSSSGAPNDPTSSSQIDPPKLVHYETAVLPDSYSSTEPVAVDLELTIDERGQVAEVNALSALEPEVVASVLRAAKAFTFEPARLNGQAIAVKVPYRYWLEANPKSESTGPAVSSNSPGAASVATSGTSASSKPNDSSEAKPSQPKAAESAVLEDERYEAVATVAAPPREPTRYELKREELTSVPGTRGDPLRAVETLPGVGRSPDGGMPILRGAAQFESATFVDGAGLPFLYHFGGTTSVINPRLIDRVQVVPGNFSSRYGRVAGGIVEVQIKPPERERFGAVADVNLIDSSLLLSSPLGKDTQVAVAGRRSNIDFVFDKLVPKDTFNVVAAPLYWDYQAVVEHKFNHGRFRVAALGASDQLRFVFSEPNKESPALRGNVSAKLEFHRLQLLHEMQLGKSHGANILQRAQVTLGLQFLDQQVGPAIATLRTQDLESRLEWELPTTDFMTLLAGFDFVGQRAHGGYRGFAAQSNEGAQPLSFSAQDLILVDTTTFYLINPAAYIEARVLPTASWTLLPGIRVDYAHQLDAVTVDPRFAQRWEVVPDTTLKSAIGFYSQAPQYYESLKGVGNPNVNPYHALHASVGVEQHVTDGFDVSSEAFYKYLYDRVVGTEAGAPPFFVNQGQGRIFGIETGATLALGDLRARGAYTLSRSERQDRADPWRLFDQDQTHVLSLAANYRLGAGWELGSRYRYITGNPTTPIDGAVYDATRGVYLPHIGRLNTARDPAFSELDVRIEKQFAIGTGKLAAYLDVQNVTFRDNKQGYTYSYDYSVRQGASTTPFFPNLGLRGEL